MLTRQLCVRSKKGLGPGVFSPRVFFLFEKDRPSTVENTPGSFFFPNTIITPGGEHRGVYGVSWRRCCFRITRPTNLPNVMKSTEIRQDVTKCDRRVPIPRNRPFVCPHTPHPLSRRPAPSAIVEVTPAPGATRPPSSPSLAPVVDPSLAPVAPTPAPTGEESNVDRLAWETLNAWLAR